MPEHTPSWCLLHELAQAMTTTADGRSGGHGPVFIWIYLQLLSRYLRLGGWRCGAPWRRESRSPEMPAPCSWIGRCTGLDEGEYNWGFDA
jgi:hypothetical protein